MPQPRWHTTRKLKLPNNLTLVPLPPACPELNSAENIWQDLRQTYLSNRVFESYTRPMPVRTPGASYSQKSAASRRSQPAIGPLSVNDFLGWYNMQSAWI